MRVFNHLVFDVTCMLHYVCFKVCSLCCFCLILTQHRFHEREGVVTKLRRQCTAVLGHIFVGQDYVVASVVLKLSKLLAFCSHAPQRLGVRVHPLHKLRSHFQIKEGGGG